MATREDIESFLLRVEQSVEEVEPGMWVLGADSGRLVIHYSAPHLLLRVKVLDVPKEDDRCIGLFRRLLELNAEDLVHGAYAIEEGDIILTDTLELENLDFSEFQATIDSIQLAIASHFETLAAYREC
ncbi:MAG: hypothetical protein GEU90_13830 [Gemmatimonas sp.]|nr:hypothetical protein [Gemmatimonas sp.]